MTHGPNLGAAPDKRLILSLVLNLVITLLQIAGGIVANSLGLLSDAAHNLSDVVALGLSLWAVRLGRRPATPRRTFAYKRAEILVAMFNSAVLIAISVFITVEAIRRLLDPQPVDGLWVVGFAAGGLVINGLAALLLRSHGHDLNMRSAFLHLVGDAFTSLGVMLSGLIVYLSGWNYADAIVSVLVSLWIGREAFAIVKSTVNVLMEGTPEGVDFAELERADARGTRGEGSARPPHLGDLVQRPGSVGPHRGRGYGALGDRGTSHCHQSLARPKLQRGSRDPRIGTRRGRMRREQLRVGASWAIPEPRGFGSQALTRAPIARPAPSAAHRLQSSVRYTGGSERRCPVRADVAERWQSG